MVDDAGPPSLAPADSLLKNSARDPVGSTAIRLVAVGVRVACAVIAVLSPRAAHGQTASLSPCRAPAIRVLGAQATYIAQELRPFSAAYNGPMSLVNRGDRQLSQSYGVYSGACLTSQLAVYLDAEMIRGSGISHASGLAAVTNGDVLRQGSVDLGKGPYIARLFARWTIPLASVTRDTITATTDAMPAVVSGRRIEISAGKFAATDVFDLNRYANSTRSQFLDWVLFNNGAWDYAADTRGYSNGVAFAWINPRWALRAGSFQMPTFANGNRFDNDLANARGDNVEVTLSSSHDAVIRVLGYLNHARMGRYASAIAVAAARGTKPDIVADDARGRTKYGVAANAELPIADSGNTGAFARVGWNDGRNESFVFTESDRHVSGGGQIAGSHWRRSGDVVGIAIAADGLSHDHRAYLAAGGNGFLLGDGALRYGSELLTELYYNARLVRFVTISPDLMRIVNPGYNRDRGAAFILSARGNIRY